MKDFKHFIVLAGILAVGFALFWLFNFNRQAQIGITIALGAAYVIWGMIHHALRKELHPRIILEYLLVATLACILVIFLLLRS